MPRTRHPLAWRLTEGRPGLLVAVLNLGLGLVLLAGGPNRTSGPSFAAVKQVAPISVWAWLFVAGGLVCLLASSLGRWGAVAVAVGAGLHAFWAMRLYQSTRLSDHAAYTGTWTYSWLALLHLHTGVRLAMRVS